MMSFLRYCNSAEHAYGIYEIESNGEMKEKLPFVALPKSLILLKVEDASSQRPPCQNPSPLNQGPVVYTLSGKTWGRPDLRL